MKLRYVDFYLFVLVSLCAVIIIGITGCGRDDDNTEPEEAGSYTLVSVTTLGVTLHAPETITGSLQLNNGNFWSMELDDDEPYIGDDWDPAANILYDGFNEIPYSFDGDTLTFTLSDSDDDEIVLVWKKD